MGSTVTEFYTRWSNHKSHINTKKKTCTLAKHFIEQKCGLQNLKVTLIEKVKVKNLDYTLKIGKATGNASYLLCNHMALMSEKNLKGVPTNLSLSITRFVCCSHRTQLSTDFFSSLSVYFYFFILFISLILHASTMPFPFFIGHGWLDIHGVCLHFYCLSL